MKAKKLDDDWDPEPAERAHYSHSVTGDHGYLVRRDGKDAIRLDRPGVEDIRSFDAREWVAKLDVRPLQPAQLAQVAFEADQQLCRALGLREFTKQLWLDLSQEQRRAWILKGPQSHPDRKALYAAVTKTLKHLAA